MNASTESWIASLGLLRASLFALAILNMLISAVNLQLPQTAAAADAPSVWEIVAVYVTPVLAPIFIVVILFDYVMSRVRAADSEGSERTHYRNIGRLELALIGFTLLYWIPYFIKMMG